MRNHAKVLRPLAQRTTECSAMTSTKTLASLTCCHIRPALRRRHYSGASMTDPAFQKCISPECAATYSVDEQIVACPRCGSLLDIKYDWDRLGPPTFKTFEAKWSRRWDPLAFSGVWRFHELLPFARPEHVVTIGEGQTLLQQSAGVGKYVGLIGTGQLWLQ